MEARSSALRRLTDRIVEASHLKTALDIRGGRTKYFYGGTPRGEALEMGELQGITSYEPTELVVTALAGTPLSELEAVLADRGQCLPFEPPRFGANGTVGGMVAAGLAGPARASVGPLRDFVLGVSILNGLGETLTFGGQVMKNVAGYDVSRLIAGSMGILGVICEVSLKVMPAFAASTTRCFDSDQASALKQLNRWAGEPFPVSASSWHQGRLFVRFAGAQAAVDSVRQRVGGAEVEARSASEWWTVIRDQRHEFFNFADGELDRGECLWRLSVRDTSAPISLPGTQFIEWGGAQRWLRSAAPAKHIRSAASSAGGHATLVRGADKSAGVFTALAQPLMAIHRRLKHSFDPAGIFNPGRLYEEL
jgi:glycolate oxidase FAD binding subunit